MTPMISIRLDSKTEHRVREEAEKYQVSVSEYVRAALEEKLARDGEVGTAYEAGAHLFGRHSSGDSERSENSEERIREKLRARHHR